MKHGPIALIDRKIAHGVPCAAGFDVRQDDGKSGHDPRPLKGPIIREWRPKAYQQISMNVADDVI